jgi:hypothetical protein
MNDGQPTAAPRPIATLRQYDECAERVAAGTANPLDVFIFENEPAGHAASDKFRAELEAAIKWLTS